MEKRKVRLNVNSDKTPAKAKKPSKIFISWSKDNSKKIALALKDVLENNIFNGKGLTCFVSDVDIASGDDWWKKIRRELKSSSMGILCVTKENVKEPWIYFEGGALTANNIATIPLLISCDIKSLEHSPFSSREWVQFYDEKKFMKMIADINDKLKLLDIDRKQLDIISSNAYKELKDTLSETLQQLKDSRYFNEKYVYPSSISIVKKHTLYISVPISSGLSEEEYKSLKDCLNKIKEMLEKKGLFTDIICPAFDIDGEKDYEGSIKVVNNVFSNLKQVDSHIVIYPRKMPSSVLIELGYGIALTKKTLVFYHEELPYIVKDAAQVINHVHTCHYDNYDALINYLSRNVRPIFFKENDE